MRNGGYIITRSGKKFWPLDPRPEDLDINDIAHALSQINRFCGHAVFPYSVAQHSVLCSLMVEPEFALSALLHDAAEAYVNDLPSPLKHELPEYMRVENRILECINEKFDVDTSSPEVKAVDLKMLVTEAKVLCNGADWYLDPKYPPGYESDVTIEPWTWQSAKEIFLARFSYYKSEQLSSWIGK